MSAIIYTHSSYDLNHMHISCVRACILCMAKERVIDYNITWFISSSRVRTNRTPNENAMRYVQQYNNIKIQSRRLDEPETESTTIICVTIVFCLLCEFWIRFKNGKSHRVNVVFVYGREKHWKRKRETLCGRTNTTIHAEVFNRFLSTFSSSVRIFLKNVSCRIARILRITRFETVKCYRF